MDLHCIFKSCHEEAYGIVMVNTVDPVLTVFMIPACKEHGIMIKSNTFTIKLESNVDPEIIISEHGSDKIPADLTLQFDIFEDHHA
jgi:hypothetical protein